MAQDDRHFPKELAAIDVSQSEIPCAPWMAVTELNSCCLLRTVYTGAKSPPAGGSSSDFSQLRPSGDRVWLD